MEGWKSDVKHALCQDRQWLEAMFPDLTPGCSYGQSYPACLGKQSIPGEMPLRWRADAPEELKCKYCGYQYQSLNPGPDHLALGLGVDFLVGTKEIRVRVQPQSDAAQLVRRQLHVVMAFVQQRQQS